jgi:amidase
MWVADCGRPLSRRSLGRIASGGLLDSLQDATDREDTCYDRNTQKLAGVLVSGSFAGVAQLHTVQSSAEQVRTKRGSDKGGNPVDNLTYTSAAALARAIRNKEVSSEEVVNAHLHRIETVNPRLNAVVQVVAEKARAQAREADAALARGKVVGPLHGVPMTIKDALDTVGVISTGGTQGRANLVPAHDATVVARLRKAGAILLGKTNTPELTLAYETDNIIYGRTNNPYDVSRTCGGSSGGAGAIVAAGGSSFDIGSDTGGSIRVPSHYCGIAGIRPTSGRVPRTGHTPPPGGALDALTQVGPLARYVEDLTLILPIIAGIDWHDAAIVPMTLGAWEQVEFETLRVAVYTDNGIVSPTHETVGTVQAATTALADAGATVTEARPAGIEQTFDLFMGLLGGDGGAGIQMLLQMYGTTQASPVLQGVLQTLGAHPMSTAQFAGLLVQWDIFRSTMLSFMEAYDVILCPVCAQPAPPHGFSYSQEGLRTYSYTQTYNLTGWPAAVVRGGTSPGGLPIGVQIVARPWREDVALAVAQYLEKALGGWRAPSL